LASHHQSDVFLGGFEGIVKFSAGKHVVSVACGTDFCPLFVDGSETDCTGRAEVRLRISASSVKNSLSRLNIVQSKQKRFGELNQMASKCGHALYKRSGLPELLTRILGTSERAQTNPYDQ